jgi:glutamate/tyrosine decarboxylase-like PLP-dependent enzyme
LSDEDHELLRDAAERGVRYRAGLDQRTAQPLADSLARMRARLAGDLPEHGTTAAEVIALLDEVGSPATVGSGGGRYFGFVVGGSHPVAVAAHWLATAWDQNAALVEMSPIAAHLDELALTWMRQALRLPEAAVGGLVTGATAANLVALAAARTHLLRRLGWDVEARGLYGAPELQVVASDCIHDSVRKGLMLLGLGHERVRVVPSDGEGRIRVDAMPPLDERTIVCLQAGHVHTGAMDPVGEVAALAALVGAWVHVDGAFGLWARATPTLDALTEGLELADSWATDAHKWLNVPYDSGAVFTVHDDAIRAAMAVWSPLLQAERQPAAYTLEQSRRARGVDVWATLACLGRQGVAQLVEGSCAAAQELATHFRSSGWQVPHEVVLNQVLVSFGDDNRTDRVLRELNREGIIGCTGAHWKGRRLLRFSISSWSTNAADIEAALAAVTRAVARTA